MEKDKLYDALLKEHAKHGAGDDEAFLKELDERISAKEKVVVMPSKKQSPGKHWMLGSGVAASIALGFSVLYFSKSNEENNSERFNDLVVGTLDSSNQVAESTSELSDDVRVFNKVEIDEQATLVQEADASLLAGRKKYAEAHYEEAVVEYKKALDLLPEGAENSDRRHAYTGHLIDGRLALSQVYRRAGRYAEARQLLMEVSKVDPRNHGAKQQLAYLDDPIRMNPVVLVDAETSQKVRKHLYRAEGYSNLGKYEDAENEYKEILREDRYNKAARRGMEKVASLQSNYHRAAYDQTRAELLMSVDKAWEIEVPARRMSSAPSASMAKVITGAALDLRKADNLDRGVSGEKYGALTDNKWTAPIDERSSLSTFAVDVDTASYANIRRMINQGQSIPKDSVRIEEMVNYFDYQYAQPTGNHPFAVHVDSSASPWDANNRIVRIGLQGKEIVREERPATNLVFLLDVSGSMNSPDKLPLLKQSMKYLLEELNENDTVSIVVYAGASGLALPATNMDDTGRQKVLDKMQSLSAGGSTAGGQGIQLAYKVAQQNFKKGGVNRIILATDGDFNVGASDNASLTKLVKEKAKAGTYISVLGLGSGNINDSMLESITNNGNGNYSYIDSTKEGRKVLLEDMMGTMVTIAKDVKVQVEMNPNKVKAYRLIGYANRMLPPEAFLDKKVDAGEIGAGHTVTALYEIIPADGKPFGANIDASRYFEKVEQKPNSALKDSKEMLFVKLAYKQPDQKIDDESTYLTVPFTDGNEVEASADQKFATAVALFGMTLRDSEYKGTGNLKMVLELANKGKDPDGKGQRAEFIKLVEKLSKKE